MQLENARIASPCNARWSTMEGDARVRFCGECGKNVYNLSALPRAEAERLLQEREGSLCIRLYKRADGTVMTTDCPVGVRRLRVRRVVGMTAGLGAAVLAVTVAVWRRQPPPPPLAALVTAVSDVAVPSVPAPAPVPETTSNPTEQGMEPPPQLAPDPKPPQPKIALPAGRPPHRLMGAVVPPLP